MSEKNVKAAMDMGLKDAQAAIAKGEAQSLDDLIHYYSLKKVGSPLIKGHSYGSFLEAKERGEIPENDMSTDPYMKKYFLL